MHEKKINQTYLREFFGALSIYMIVLLTIPWMAKGMPDGPLLTMLALLPMLPALGMLWVIIRHFKRLDEYLRVWTLENIAIAGAITATFSLTYGFLEGVGFPHLSMFVILGVFMGGWGVIACVRKAMEN